MRLVLAGKGEARQRGNKKSTERSKRCSCSHLQTRSLEDHLECEASLVYIVPSQPRLQWETLAQKTQNRKKEEKSLL